jgi:anti-sigma regulatory factor (Ser/Thr protein kinase)
MVNDLASETTRTTSTTLPGQDMTSPGAARRWLAHVLAGWGLGGGNMAADLTLVVSELVTNAVVHTFSRTIELRLECPDDGTLTINVFDEGPRPAAFKARCPQDPGAGGLGLPLVESCTAGRWGEGPFGSGSWVWATVSIPCRPARDEGR